MAARRSARQPVLSAVLAAVLVFALAACGGGDDTGVADTPQADAPQADSPQASEPAADDDAATEPASGDAVLVQGFRFQPAELTVAPGATVTWTNEDDIRHTATSGEPSTPDGTFAVSLDGKGSSGSFTFAEAGTYAYYCEVHESMRGTVVVSG